MKGKSPKDLKNKIRTGAAKKQDTGCEMHHFVALCCTAIGRFFYIFARTMLHCDWSFFLHFCSLP
jgi:hypothetical protein